MKKVLPIVLMICAIILTGCGFDEDEFIEVGTIKYLNVSEEDLDEFLNKENPSPKKRKHIFFDNMTSLVAALDSRRVEEISIYETVAHYLTAQHNDLRWEISEPIVTDVFCCALREEDVELKRKFDDAILQITEDGTLSKLVKNYLTEVARGDEPQIVHLPTFYDAQTIRVGVTGDLPLIDYIRPDGEPSGFNTALLAEISKILGVNFVLVQIDSGARAAALSSKRVDVIFWSVMPKDKSIIPKNFDKPDGMILTEPYFSDEIVHVRLVK